MPKELVEYLESEPKKLTPIDVWRKLGPLDIEDVFKQSPFRFGNDLVFGESKDGYMGLLLDKKRHGLGRQMSEDQSIYEGQFLNDERNGYGRLIWADGDYYEGLWKDDMKHGFGKYVFEDGEM